MGGLGLATAENKIDIETKILHQGEVNRARYLPQKFNVIATKTTSGEVHVFDYTQHPTKPENDIVRPQLRLMGHSKEGYYQRIIIFVKKIKDMLCLGTRRDKAICCLEHMIIKFKNILIFQKINKNAAFIDYPMGY